MADRPDIALTPGGLRVVAKTAAAIVLSIGLLVLLCWLVCHGPAPGLSSLAHTMHPLTAALLVIAGIGLLKTAEKAGGMRRPTNTVGILVCAIVLVTTASLSLADLFGLPISLERLLATVWGSTDPVLAEGMGSPTALNFLFCGLGLLLLDFQTSGGHRPCQTFIIAAGMISLMALIVWSYKIVAVHSVTARAPISLLTALAFAVWCVGAFAARPEQGVLSLFNSPTIGGAMARRLLPMAILIPWVIGGFRWLGETAGFYDTEFGVALFAVSTVLIFTGLIWWNATLLHLADLERRKTEEQLRQATRDLERSNKELQQFAYVASHDLFEPLRMITSYLQLLQETQKGKLDPRSQEFIGHAVDGARRMRALIEDLLAYSRVEALGEPLKEVDCEQVVRAAVTNLKVAIEEARADVKVGPLPRVVGDAVQLTQLFQNLIGNAVKFRGASPPVVEIGATRRQNEWIIHVRDTGIGIAPQHFERIFVIFQRLHTRREYPGTGMGLAICKKIVERHGGRIWVESTPGKGSTFFIALPANE